MALITVYALGKLKNKSFLELQNEYLSRLKHYTSCQLTEINDLQSIKKETLLYVLDQNGKQLTSEDFSKKLNQHQNLSHRHVGFLIGGPYGIDMEVKKKAHFLLSLSTLTLPHELARVVLLEQLYRAFTILKGEGYHH